MVCADPAWECLAFFIEHKNQSTTWATGSVSAVLFVLRIASCLNHATRSIPFDVWHCYIGAIADRRKSWYRRSTDWTRDQHFLHSPSQDSLSSIQNFYAVTDHETNCSLLRSVVSAVLSQGYSPERIGTGPTGTTPNEKEHHSHSVLSKKNESPLHAISMLRGHRLVDQSRPLRWLNFPNSQGTW